MKPFYSFCTGRLFKAVSLALFVSAAGTARADDTDIYFTSIPRDISGADVLANVLFILDTSSSMNIRATGSDVTRLDAVKASVANLLQNSQNLRVGLMTFNHVRGGDVRFPLSGELSSSIATIPSETGALEAFANITDGAGDVVQTGLQVSDEAESAPVGRHSPSLIDRHAGGVGTGAIEDNQGWVNSATGTAPVSGQAGDAFVLDGMGDRVGFRFPAINLPRNASLIIAQLDLAPASSDSSVRNVDIAVLRASSLTGDGAIDLARTAIANQAYTLHTGSSAGGAVDVTALVNAALSDASWGSGGGLYFRIRSTGGVGTHRYFNHLAAAATDRPRLQIGWTPASTTQQYNSVGLHFEELYVPQGATITNVNLSLFSSGDNTALASWRFHAEAADDATAFDTSVSGDVSNRTTTMAGVRWQLSAAAADAMNQGQYYRVCDIGACGPCTAGSCAAGSATLATVIQEIVNRSGWCGGQAINLLISPDPISGDSRDIAFSESGSVFAPRLSVQYTGDGCMQQVANLEPQATNDVGNVGQDPPTGAGFVPLTDTLTLGTDSNSDTLAAYIRFANVNIPPNATINDARLLVGGIVTISLLTDQTYTIAGLAADNVAAVGSGSSVPRATSKTSQTGTLPVAASLIFGDAESSDLSSVIQAIVGRTGWRAGNALGLYITGGSNTVPAYHNVGGPSGDVGQLSIMYTGLSGVMAAGTVRERLTSLTRGLRAGGRTPIVLALAEAARYWRGEDVYFGKDRLDRASGHTGSLRGIPETYSVNRLSHPGSYCEFDASNSLSCPGVTLSSSTPYGISTPLPCPPDDLYDKECDAREILGNPRYLSPFRLPVELCEGHHQILITDGFPNVGPSLFDVEKAAYLAERTSLLAALGIVATNCQNLPGPVPYAVQTGSLGAISGGRCGIELAEHLRKNDQNTAIEGKQTVATHTISFDLAGGNLSQATVDEFNAVAEYYLGGIADAGGGEYYRTDNAVELLDAFENIFSEIRAGAASSSIASPSLSSNSFNRLRSRDKVYFGLFKPSKTVSWSGNVRKYDVCISATCATGGVERGTLLDANGNRVTDVDGAFLETSTSLWASSSDGSAVDLGGAGAKDRSANALIYTDARSGGTLPSRNTPLNNTGHSLSLTNWTGANVAHIRQAMCGTTTEVTDSSDCGQLVRWWLGVDVDSSATPTPERWAFHDVLHSSPEVITYGGDRVAGTFIDRLVVGTNDGALRFINADTGVTQWRFYPQSLLGGLRLLYADAEADHPYGVDLTPVVQLYDRNRNGVIQPTAGDFVRVFAGMRRGGSELYALDLTPGAVLSSTATVVPKFLWRISSSSSGFSRLGQTWSQPVVARIALKVGNNTGPADVLIFGGGYDLRLDNAFQVPNGALGNAIYIVDPRDGDLLLGITGNCTGCDGHIRVPNMDYSIPSSVALLDSDGDGLDDRIYVGDTGGQVWRVDLDPELVQGSAGNTVVGRLANISMVGTAAVQHKFFEEPAVLQVLDSQYSDAAGGEYDYVLIGSGDRPNPLATEVTDRFYAFRDRQIGKLPDADSNNLADSSGYATISEANLVDATALATLDGANNVHKAAKGWYYTFPATKGEKVYSSPTVVAGAVLFTTYLPLSRGGGACSANIGFGNAYNFNVLTTAATIDWDEDGTLEPKADRKKELGSGIPSGVLPLFTDAGVVGIVGIEGGAVAIGALSDLPRTRTYWYEDAW